MNLDSLGLPRWTDVEIGHTRARASVGRAGHIATSPDFQGVDEGFRARV